MRRISRKIATLLIAILFATVLAPSFGWDTSAGQGAHEENIGALADSCDTQDSRGGENSHHHGCAGHMLGHLVAHLSDAAIFTLPDLRSRFLPEPDAGVLPGFQERLYRPPLTPALA